MTGYEHIFTPVQIGRLTVKNRIESAPGGPFLATGDGDVSRELIEWYRPIAKGGAGIVTIGDSPVVGETALGVGHILNLGTDRITNGLFRLAEVIKRYGARASIELTHHVDFPPPARMTREEIRSLIKAFADAAYRSLGAGLDMIMIHGAHGQLISQFFSPLKNLRTDDYGGPLKNRARFVCDLLDAVRDRVGDELAVEYRISGDELTPGGLNVEEQIEFARLIQDKVDLIHVSAGHFFAPDTLPRMFPAAYLPHGVNVYLAQRFKRELAVPVAAVGAIDFELAEEIIAGNKADVVGMVRNIIADPGCVSKVKKGARQEVRPCVRCNICIDNVHWPTHVPARCSVNPVAGREADFVHLPLPGARKKVVVIGGGPAGMEAARTAAGRGHQVVLLERESQLGGSLIQASAPPFKADLKAYLDWAVRTTLHTPDVTVRLATEATPDGVGREAPDALIIAVGATPVLPDLPGLDRGTGVAGVGDVFLGRARTGGRVVVAGAGPTGLEAALHLALQDKRVTVVDMRTMPEIHGRLPAINLIGLQTQLALHGVDLRTQVKLDGVDDNGAVVIDKNWNRIAIPCDTVVLALGVEPRRDVVRRFENLAPEVYLAGDCRGGRCNLLTATTEGFNAAMDI